MDIIHVWVTTSNFCHLYFFHRRFVVTIIHSLALLRWLIKLLSFSLLWGEVITIYFHSKLEWFACILVIVGLSSIQISWAIAHHRLLCCILWYEALVFWHCWIASAHHHLSVRRAAPFWTNICFHNMIIRIKIRVYLNMIVITTKVSRLLRLNIIIKRILRSLIDI